MAVTRSFLLLVLLLVLLLLLRLVGNLSTCAPISITKS